MLPETLLMDIAQFAFSHADERNVALAEFEKSLQGRLPTEGEMESFDMDYMFSRKHSVHNKSFIRLFVEKFEELYGKEWSREILSLEDNFEAYFEVVECGKDSITLTELIIGDHLEVQNPSGDCTLNKGDLLLGRLFKWKGYYHFLDSPFVITTPQDIEGARAFTTHMKRMLTNITESSLEYFGSDVVIFQDNEELEKKLDEFVYWFFRNRVPPGVYEEGEVLDHITFEELSGRKEIGLIIDYATGHRVIPEYGYAVNLFSGRWDKVPNYEDMAKRVLYYEEIPAYYVEKMIEENPETSVELYATIFPDVKTKEDLIALFAHHRRDWGMKLRRKALLLEK
jgi:hypothetical protein